MHLYMLLTMMECSNSKRSVEGFISLDHLAVSGVGEIAASTNAVKDIEDLRKQMRYRRVWMASSVHEGELEGWCSNYFFISKFTTVSIQMHESVAWH